MLWICIRETTYLKIEENIKSGSNLQWSMMLIGMHHNPIQNSQMPSK